MTNLENNDSIATKDTVNPLAKAKKVAHISINDPNSAFVRVLEPNQAMIPGLLRPAMEVFGTVVAIAMRKRKDLASVRFANSESLHKASAASPVTVSPQITVKVVKQQVKGAAV